MAENTVEAVIRMRDLASQAMLQMNKSLELLDEASKGADKGLRRVEVAGDKTRGTISILSRTTRFAAIGFISELDPAMGQVVARMTSLGSVAAATGSLLKGGLIVGGITLVVGALSNWVQATNRQIEFQLQLNRTVGEFNVSGATGQIRELVIQQEQFRAKTSSGLGPVIQFWKDLFNTITTGQTQQEELTRNFEQTKQVWDRMRIREFAGQMAELAIQVESVTQAEIGRRLAHAETVPAIQALGQAEIASIRAQEKASLDRLRIEEGTARQIAVTNELGGAELTRIAEEFGTKRALVTAQTAEKIAASEDKIGEAVERTRQRLQNQITTMIDLQSQIRQQERVGAEREIGEADSAEQVQAAGDRLAQILQLEQAAAAEKIDLEQKSLRERRVARKITEDELLAGEAQVTAKREALAIQSTEAFIALEKKLQTAGEQTVARREEQAGRIAQLNLNLLQQQEAVIQQQLGQATTGTEVSRLTEQLKANILAQQQHALERLAIEEEMQIELANAAKRGAETIAAIETEFGLRREVIAGQTASRIREVTERETQELQKVGQQATGALETTLSGTLVKFAQGAGGFQDLWQGLWNNLIKITADAAAQILLTGAAGFGGGGGGGGILGLFSSVAGLFTGGGGGGAGIGTSDILRGFQLGGKVSKMTAALLHPGERVMPASEERRGGEGMGGTTVINLSDPGQLAALMAQETSKGREVVINDVIQGMRGNRAVRRSMQRFR